MTTQVETTWSFINHSNCEATRNRTIRSGRFGLGHFDLAVSVWWHFGQDISVHEELHIPLIKW